MAESPINYLEAMGGIADPIAAINQAAMAGLQQQQMRDQHLMNLQAIGQARQQQNRQQLFQADAQRVMSNPDDVQGYSDLMLRYPEFRESISGAFSQMDKAKKTETIRNVSSVFFPGLRGDYATSAKVLKQRIEADTAAGRADPHDAEILAELESGDPKRQRAAIGLIGAPLYAADPEHFAGAVQAITKNSAADIRNVNAGDEVISVDPDTGVATKVYESPYIKGADGTLYARDGAGTGGGGLSPSGELLSPTSVAGLIDKAEGRGKNPRSSAEGVGNFIDSTFLATYKKHGDAAGKSDAEILALKRNPQIAAAMLEAHTQDNMAALKAANIAPTPANAYLAHFLGMGRAPSVIRAAPDAPVSGIVGEAVMKANPFLAGMSAGQLRAWSARKMSGGSTSGNGLRVVIPGKPKDAPSGYEYTGDGKSLRPISGGPADPNNGVLGDKDSRAARKEAMLLRKEFNALEPVKVFNELRPALRTIEAVAQKQNSAKTPNPQSDTQLIYNFMRMAAADGSVIREGEFALVGKSASYAERINRALQHTYNGNQLTRDMRNDIVSAARQIYLPRRDAYNSVAEQYQSYARDAGFEPTHVARRAVPDGGKPATPKFKIVATRRPK